jgi:hypothetical protein
MKEDIGTLINVGLSKKHDSPYATWRLDAGKQVTDQVPPYNDGRDRLNKLFKFLGERPLEEKE